MSEWDFLWDLSGQELIDAMESGGTEVDWEYIEEQDKMQQKNVDIICIATSDKGYADTVKVLRGRGKRVVVIGEDKTPVELRGACSKFVKV